MQNLLGFFQQYRQLRYKKNNNVINAFDIPQGVYYVDEGYIRMFSTTSEGKELTLNIFKPGTFFPMIWAITDAENRYDFVTLTPAVLRRAPKDKVISFIKSNPEELYLLTKRILIGYNGVFTNPEQLLFGDAFHRVTAVILLLTKRFGQKQNNNLIQIPLRLTHQDIGSLCGLTRETVTLEIQKLIKKGVIAYQKRSFVVKNLTQLESLLSEPA